MKHHIIIFGKDIDLSDASTVEQAMQKVIDLYYPPLTVYVRDYKELDDDSFELTILRQFKDGAGTSLPDFICDHDESLITGMDISAFQPFDLNQKQILLMIPWYDDMVYSPLVSFYELWKSENKAMIGVKIKDIQIVPEKTSIYIKVTFNNGKRKPKRKKSAEKV